MNGCDSYSFKTFGAANVFGDQLCFDMDSAAANKKTADRFCVEHGFARSQAAETTQGSNAKCATYASGTWELKNNEGASGAVTKGNRVVRIECVKQ